MSAATSSSCFTTFPSGKGKKKEEVCLDGLTFHSFRLRGEGLSSFAVSAIRQDGQKIVWRFRKDKKTRILCSISDAELLAQYIRRIIAPLLGLRYVFVTTPRVAFFDLQNLHNLFRTKELSEYFPENFLSPIAALEMPNFTLLDAVPGYFPSINVEIKPKQGFMSDYFTPSGLQSPYCTNCLLQMGKVQTGAYPAMYDFCPLDLYSGHLDRMMHAIKSLIRIPHNNLRIVREGELVFNEDYRVDDPSSLSSLVFPDGEGTTEDFVVLLCRILSGSLSPSRPFSLDKDSVLSHILNIQRLDSIGLIQAADFYKSLPEPLKGSSTKCLSEGA